MNSGVLGLSIVELVFYTISFPVTIVVCNRHGWARTSGWIFLFIFVLMRLMSSASTIAAIVLPNDTAAFIVSTVMNSAGTTTLLLTQLGILRRLQRQSQCKRQTPPQLFYIIVLALLAMLGVSIAAGVFLFSTDPNENQTGHSLSLGTGGLALGILGLLIWCILATTLFFRYDQATDSILLYTAWVALPFLTAKVVYIALISFQADPSVFKYVDGNILAVAFMNTLPEFLAVLVYLIGGLYAPPGKHIRGETVKEKTARNDVGMIYADKGPSSKVLQMED